jgi:uncharacterized protein (DUF1499 family)
LTVLCIIAEMLSGFGTRWGFWNFRTGLGILRWTVYGDAVAVLVTIVSCIIARYTRKWGIFISSIILIIAGIAAASIPLKMYRDAQSLPAIHDITTDTENPPQFNIILELRKDAPNSAEYGGPVIGSEQLSAYPDIKPVMLAVPPRKAFDICLATAHDMGWDIVNADMDKGIIEGTDTTFWFGFKDDIIIRITPSEKGSRVDLRSVSRVGKSDVGANAERIRDFINRLGKKS